MYVGVEDSVSNSREGNADECKCKIKETKKHRRKLTVTSNCSRCHSLSGSMVGSLCWRACSYDWRQQDFCPQGYKSSPQGCSFDRRDSMGCSSSAPEHSSQAVGSARLHCVAA